MTDPHREPREKSSAEQERARRRRRAEVFGDVLPDQTSDDREHDGAPEKGGDRWLEDQVPPHHGS